MPEIEHQKSTKPQSERWQFYLYVFTGWKRKVIGAIWGLPPAVVGIYAAFRGEFGFPKLTDVMPISTWFVVGIVWLVIAFIITILVSTEGSYHYASSLRTMAERKVKEDVLDEKLLTTLRHIAQTSRRNAVLYTDSMYASLEGRTSEIQRSICDANSEVLLICYSLTFWKDKIEEQIHKFLAKDDSMFKVLMLMPSSSGFVEKSALEAFQYRGMVPTDMDAWLRSTEEIRKAHRSDIGSSIDTLVLWQQKYGKTKVDFRFYVDTPVLYGFSCDRKVFCVSSYFINPIERAFRLPSRVFDLSEDVDPFSAMVASVFLNWFDTKFATGFESSQIGWQK